MDYQRVYSHSDHSILILNNHELDIHRYPITIPRIFIGHRVGCRSRLPGPGHIGRAQWDGKGAALPGRTQDTTCDWPCTSQDSKAVPPQVRCLWVFKPHYKWVIYIYICMYIYIYIHTVDTYITTYYVYIYNHIIYSYIFFYHRPNHKLLLKSFEHVWTKPTWLRNWCTIFFGGWPREHGDIMGM